MTTNANLEKKGIHSQAEWQEAYDVAKSQIELCDAGGRKFSERFGLNLSEARKHAYFLRLRDFRELYEEKIEELEKKTGRELDADERNQVILRSEEEFPLYETCEKYVWTHFSDVLERHPKFRKYFEKREKNPDKKVVAEAKHQFPKDELKQDEKYVVTDTRGGEVVLVTAKDEVDVARAFRDEAIDAGVLWEDTLDLLGDSSYEITPYSNWLEVHSEDEIDRERIF